MAIKAATNNGKANPRRINYTLTLVDQPGRYSYRSTAVGRVFYDPNDNMWHAELANIGEFDDMINSLNAEGDRILFANANEGIAWIQRVFGALMEGKPAESIPGYKENAWNREYLAKKAAEEAEREAAEKEEAREATGITEPSS